MAIYTYTGNKIAGETTSQLVLRGGALIINLNQYADITADELAALSARYQLTMGQSPGAQAAGPSYPGLYNLLNPLAVSQLVNEVLTSGSLVGLPPADSTVITTGAVLFPNKRASVDATAGVVAMTLPDPSTVVKGTTIGVSKAPGDTSSNAVTVTGLIDGVTTTHNLTLPKEGRVYEIDSSGSWTVVADHKTLASLKNLWDAADQAVLNSIPGIVAASSTVVSAAASAATTAVAALDILTGQTRDSTSVIFGVTDLNGRRSALEIGYDGRFTPEAAAMIAAQVATAVGAAIGLEIGPSSGGSGVAYAVVDSAGRASWIQAGVDGRPTQATIDMLTAALSAPLGTALNATLTSSIGIDSTSSGAGSGVWFGVVDSVGRRSVLEIDETGMFTDRALALLAGKIGVGVSSVGLANLKPEVSNLLRRVPAAYTAEISNGNLYTLETATGIRRIISTGNTPTNPKIAEDDWILWTDSSGDHARKCDASSLIVKPTTDQSIVLWGDSYTQANAGPWDAALATITGLPVLNLGLSGITSTDIGIRQGGVEPVFTVPSGALPAGTTAETLALVSPTTSYRNTTGTYSFAGTLAGVAGTLTQSLNVWTFQRTTAGSAVTVSGQAKFHGTIGDAHTSKLPVIFTGRNNYFNPGTVMADVLRDNLAMVNHMSVRDAGRRFVIIPPMNVPTESPASGGYQSVTGIAVTLKAQWPSNTFDLRRYFIDNSVSYMTANGLTPTSQDLADIANDAPPRQLYGSDVFHPTALGYGLFAIGIGAFINGKGWNL